MANIESKMFYGDNPEIFKSLFGFEIVDVQTGHTNESNENVAIIKVLTSIALRLTFLFRKMGYLLLSHLQ